MSTTHQKSTPSGTVAEQAMSTDDKKIMRLCVQAEGITSIMNSAIETGEERSEEISSESLERLSEIGDELAFCRSKKLADIAGKIGVWRVLTHEDSLYTDKAPVDERLMHSIMRDIENLARSS